jgi:hypothetical protein
VNFLMRWPWISMLLAVLVIISPLGRDILHDAFFSGEALSRNIAQFVLLIGLAILVVITAIEWLVRMIISRRRARGAAT